MDYKIIEETEYSGKKWYYVKKRYCWYFWKYLTEYRDISMYAYKIGFHSLEEAKNQIQLDVNKDYKNSQSKIRSRNVVSV